MLKRHDLDQVRVDAETAAALVELEQERSRRKDENAELRAKYEEDIQSGRQHLWRHAPPTDAEIDSRYDRYVELEKKFFSKVTAVETEKGFYLVYGDQPDDAKVTGTGPFKTLDEASGWFFRHGR